MGETPVWVSRAISRATASYFASTARSRASGTRPMSYPRRVSRWSALSCRRSRRYSLREVIIR